MGSGNRRRDDMKFLLALCLALVAVATAQYNYDEVIHKSILFYEAERSGWLPGNNSITNAQDFYGSTGFEDELAWGALWLARATGDNSYVDRAREFVDEGKAWAYSWDSKNVGAQLLMFQQTGDGRYSRAVETFLRDYMPGGGIHQTPRGLAWRDQWGPLRYSANAAFIALWLLTLESSL